MEILRGIIEIALGRASGLQRFGATPRAVLNSLYALMVLPGISAFVMLARDEFGEALSVALILVCALLAPMIISHLLALLWKREAEWLAFATAFNWSRFAIIGVFAVMLLATMLLVQLGFPRETAANLLVIEMSFYSLWLEWFVARRTLRLSAGRALATVLMINGGTFLLLAIPNLVQRLLTGGAPGEG